MLGEDPGDFIECVGRGVRGLLGCAHALNLQGAHTPVNHPVTLDCSQQKGRDVMLRTKTVVMNLERDSNKFTLLRDWATNEVTITETDEAGNAITLTLSVSEAGSLADYLKEITEAP